MGDSLHGCQPLLLRCGVSDWRGGGLYLRSRRAAVQCSSMRTSTPSLSTLLVGVTVAVRGQDAPMVIPCSTVVSSVGSRVTFEKLVPSEHHHRIEKPLAALQDPSGAFPCTGRFLACSRHGFVLPPDVIRRIRRHTGGACAAGVVDDAELCINTDELCIKTDGLFINRHPTSGSPRATTTWPASINTTLRRARCTP